MVYCLVFMTLIFKAHWLVPVGVGSTLSDMYEKEVGVPQGSILSLVLLSPKINNIFKSVLKGSEQRCHCLWMILLFVFLQSTAHMQKDLCNCVMKIGFLKMVLIYPPAKQSVSTFVISVNTSKNHPSCWTKILLIFDWTLSSNSHVSYLKTNCFTALNILNIVGHTNWGAVQKTLLCHNWALVWSKLGYGCIVYGAASNIILEKLDPIHHWDLRIAQVPFSFNKPSCKSTRNVFEKQMQETIYEMF